MNATYYCNGIEYPATVRLDKTRLVISFVQEGNSTEVYWQYDQITAKESNRTFAYNHYPPQTLEVLKPAVAAGLREAVQRQKQRGKRRGTTPFLRLLVAVIALVVLLYVVAVPWLAGALASRFPVRYERQLGDQLYSSIRKDFKIDEPATAAINRFFKAADFPVDYPIHITVVKDNVANAFALPGGHIIVYDKLLNSLNSYEELAALLAHEAVHIQRRHTVRTLFRQAGSAIFLSLLVGDAGAVSAVILNNANELKNLSYSRSLEAEADEQGAAWLAQKGIDCRGFVQLFQVLQKQEEPAETSEWLSSHPNLDKRIKAIRENSACKAAPPQKSSALKGLFLALKTAG